LPLKQIAVKREFQKLLAIAGIRSVRLYDLRHTAATLAIAAEVSVKVISDQLGHASISFTLERYSHVLPSIQDEAAAKVEQLLVACTPRLRAAPQGAAFQPLSFEPVVIAFAFLRIKLPEPMTSAVTEVLLIVNH
jgi:hypothetical protein